MKRLPKLGVTSAALSALPFEALKWEVLKTAIELDVFSVLTEPSKTEAIAAKLSTHPASTGHLLNALVAIGCLSKADGRFCNTPLAQAVLTRGTDTSIGESLLFVESWLRPVLNGRMIGIVRDGPPPPQPIDNDETWAAGARATINEMRCGRAQRIAGRIAALPEFPSLKRILDLGAGPGLVGIATTLANPSVHCVLFDQPAVCRVADDIIEEYGLADRVITMAGDYRHDPIGGDYDLVMANYTLNFCHDRLDEIMDKVHHALNPGGVFLVTSDGLTDEKTAPAQSVISWLAVWLQGMDMSFDQGEIAAAMVRAGFVSTHTQTFDDPETAAHGPLDQTIGRKRPSRSQHSSPDQGDEGKPGCPAGSGSRQA